MQELLFLVHRIPYPPRKGDKVRSYHLLKHLSRHYRVHLATFVDDPADLVHVDTVKSMCASAQVERLRPKLARALSLRGLARGQPLTLPYFQSSRLATWIRGHMLSHRVQRVLVFSSSMAQYVLPHLRPGMRSVIDFVDVDSEKWSSYAESYRGPLGHLYRREGVRLLEFERSAARLVDASVFVTAQEAALFRHRAPESASRVFWIGNGVDTQYFRPDSSHTNPYRTHPTLVFTGAMDYRANVDAVTWFASEVFPTLKQRHRSLCFYIVGANPTPRVRALQQHEGISVTGTVEDVRPYLAHAALAVAPLRLARGVQNKVLEAMAMAQPVVATSAAMQGIDDGHGLEDQVADTPRDMAERISALLVDPARADRGVAARRFVESRYDWSRSAGRMIALLEGSESAH